MNKEKDIIDRHYKQRAILIDENLLYNIKTQDYIHELIDINEISSYYDTFILVTDINKATNHSKHWMLQTNYLKKFDEDALDIFSKKYRPILLIADHIEAAELKRLYRCETLIH